MRLCPAPTCGASLPCGYAMLLLVEQDAIAIVTAILARGYQTSITRSLQAQRASRRAPERFLQADRT
ncbi:hypothetical protein FQU75_22560 [Paenibacillus polymyxa]|nr:hypothetical protein FQU75_22560 [Paenibacillus polymyxa]